MPIPSSPSGYDVSKHVDAGCPDCHLTVGFDCEQGNIPRFLILLHYQTDADPVRWNEIARMDHNETTLSGHDVYREGLHVDISHRRGTPVHIDLSHGPLPSNRGMVIRACVDYFKQHTKYFVDVYDGSRSAGYPPRWPDGGESSHTLITSNPLQTDMNREKTADKILSVDELTAEIAEATDSTPNEINQGAEDLDINPPTEATVVDE